MRESIFTSNRTNRSRTKTADAIAQVRRITDLYNLDRRHESTNGTGLRPWSTVQHVGLPDSAWPARAAVLWCVRRGAWGR